MSIPKTPLPAQLILSVLSSTWQHFQPRLLGVLLREFGAVDYQSKTLAFTETSYYDQELGTPITRQVFGFESLIPPENLADLKLTTNALEQRFLQPDGRRTFNLDPGLLFQERLVLATGKNFSHRIYVGKGIWADLTLLYQKGKWQSLPWSFPDYAGSAMQEILTQLRNRLKAKLKNRKQSDDQKHDRIRGLYS